MSYPKLYKSKNYNEIIACAERKNEKGRYTWLDEQGNSGVMPYLMLEKCYELVSETPKPHSTAWAVMMMYAGYRVKRKHWTSGYYELKNNQIVNSQGENVQLQNYFFHNSFTDYEIAHDTTYTPKLGDNNYWQVGDDIQDLSNGKIYTISYFADNRITLECENGNTLRLSLEMMNGVGFVRKYFHMDSYVKPDGTVHEHIPTRSHYIETK